MTVEKFNEDLLKARMELKTAMTDVMDLVNSKKTFGGEWKAAVERERKAHETMRCLLDSPLASRIDLQLKK
ncbi:hypothetical protein SAMN04490185_2874 [Pseudomonas frederiksbergensis]|uniref:Uncharacterized protein n=1 Tax=Pseudomonas frederiksbergensis TaxID=104087 RepID=A0A1H4YBD8_9PSED|nr:hypothetical protein [Pseudomonas frederiksbergensis]SED15219.1 hypothetical protein SAMN04490185_2874 [Pseudomonas frederiksbergensis]